jgi:6-phosphogluconolactonase
MLRDAKTDWSRWQVWFGDERCLPSDDPQRNSAMATQALLAHVPVPASQVHTIPAELGADEAARRYVDALRGVGDFDLVLLGLGEDGHTASLFPGRDWGESPEDPDALAVHGAPKPPPERVSLCAARLSRSREVLFLADARGKRAALMRWRAEEEIPARAIRPGAGVDVLVKETSPIA